MRNGWRALRSCWKGGVMGIAERLKEAERVLSVETAPMTMQEYGRWAAIFIEEQTGTYLMPCTEAERVWYRTHGEEFRLTFRILQKNGVIDSSKKGAIWAFVNG